MKDYSNVAVLIPCYNEEQTIEKVITDFKQYLPNVKIYVYDNNSTDNTYKKAKDMDAIVRIENKQGKGNVIRRMFREIEADCYILVDGDATYSASDAPKMVSLVLHDDYDMVIGDRLNSTYFTENKRRFHNMGNVLVKKMINLVFHSNIQDVMTGYRAFSRNFVKTFPILTKNFEIETEMTIHAFDKNLSICQMPIKYQDRPEGSVSKLHTIKDGLKVLKTIFTMTAIYRPLLFWGIVSLLIGILGISLFMIPLMEYINTGLVGRFPTLIVSCFLIMIATISFFVGIILQSLRHKEKQDFEFKLIETERRNL